MAKSQRPCGRLHPAEIRIGGAAYDAIHSAFNGYNDYLVTLRRDALYRRDRELTNIGRDAVWTGSDGTAPLRCRHARRCGCITELEAGSRRGKIDINGVKRRGRRRRKPQRPESITVFLCEEGKEGFIASTVVKPNDEGPPGCIPSMTSRKCRDGQKDPARHSGSACGEV
ncbi:MAG: hypothetical protein ACLUE8_10710 [Lachnospiraceae bacterium]